MDEISKIWPKWEIEEILGEGGFGRVYKAKRQNMIDVSYSAIKVVKIPRDVSEIKEMTTSGMTQEHIKDYYKQSVLTYLKEIKLMETLKSASNIVGIEDYEVVENENGIGWTIYIRMELLTNLSDYMISSPFGIKEVLKMGIDICQALMQCHSLNIIHRDVKPANIFVSKFGDFKLGDFGVSKEVEIANATMSQKGTKSYMAPEMVRLDKNYDLTVDLYALGLTMYELLNHGRMPFLPAFPTPFYPLDKEEAMLKRLSGETFPIIEEIGDLNDIIQKACAFDPKDRYQSASELKQALTDYLNQTSQEKLVDVIDLGNSETQSEDKTIGLFSDELFWEKKEQTNDFIITDTDKTIGAFDGKLPIFDTTIEKTIELLEDLPLTHQCDVCHKESYLVFSHGYYDGKHLTLTNNDQTTLTLKKLYEDYLHSEKPKKAILKKMLKLDDCAKLHHHLAKEYMASGSKKYAREEFKVAYQKNSEDGLICKDMALVALEEKNYTLALEMIKKADALFKKGQASYPYPKRIVYAVQTIVYHKLKNHKKALAALLKACQGIETPTFDIHHYTVSYIVSEASIFEDLYQKDSWLRAEDSYVYNQLMKLDAYYGISRQIYLPIFQKEANGAIDEKTMKFLVSSHDQSISRKMTITNTYHFGYQGMYMFSTLWQDTLPYFGWYELNGDVSVFKTKNEIYIQKHQQRITIPVNKKDMDWLYTSLNKIVKTNKELLIGWEE